MKGRLFIILFGLPFAGFATWVALEIGSNLSDAANMRSWQPVQAELTSAGYEAHSGDDSTTYKAYATYVYTFNLRSYTGDRVALGSGGDNIGDYQQDLGSRLAGLHARGEPVTVLVNPDAPSESIVDPTIRWGLMAFQTIFVLVFGLVGYGLILVALFSRKTNTPEAAEVTDEPWLANEDWQGGPIRSGSRRAMWGAWLFAGLWNLISMPLPFLLVEEVAEKENYVALIGLVFPIVGLGLLYWAISRTREWRRFGATPLELDPFPGAIGGHVGGLIDIRQPFAGQARYQLTLTNLESYVSGSGKNRSRRERAAWQDRRVAHAEAGPLGTRLTFQFDVPSHLAESDAEQNTDSYTIWRLNLNAEFDGRNLDRDWELPVYPTGASSRAIDKRKVAEAERAQSTVDDSLVAERVEIRHTPRGKSLYYPMGRQAFSSLMGVFFGGIFAAAGVFLIAGEDAWFMGGMFSLVGEIIVLISLYMVGNSLEVYQDGVQLHSKRRWLGVPLRHRTLHRNAFHRFEKTSRMQSQSGGKHTFHYSILAIGQSAEEITLGEGFHGESEADAAIRLIARELGLPAPDQPSANDDAAELEYNALASDN